MPFFNNRGPSKKRPSGGGGHGKPGGRPGGRPGGGRPGGKPFGKKKSAKKRSFKKKVAKKDIFPNIESTGMEGLYFKDLIEAEQLVLVTLTDGKEVLGYVRYYDKDTISIGPEDGSPKMFMRKDGIRYMAEVDE